MLQDVRTTGTHSTPSTQRMPELQKLTTLLHTCMGVLPELEQLVRAGLVHDAVRVRCLPRVGCERVPTRCQFCNLCCAVQLKLIHVAKSTPLSQINIDTTRATILHVWRCDTRGQLTTRGPPRRAVSTDKARTVSGCWQINTISATHQRRECNREKPPIPPRELVCTAFPSHASHVKYACGSADGGG
jgi:hypothetical protein